jgi:hypothetical protein
MVHEDSVIALDNTKAAVFKNEPFINTIDFAGLDNLLNSVQEISEDVTKQTPRWAELFTDTAKTCCVDIRTRLAAMIVQPQ